MLITPRSEGAAFNVTTVVDSAAGRFPQMLPALRSNPGPWRNE